MLHYVAQETNNNNILFFNTIGFKARSLWGCVQIKFNEMQVYEGRGKPEYPEKNLSEQRREPKNSTHIWCRVWKSNPAHIGGRYATTALWLNEKKQWLDLKLKMFVQM